MTDCMQLAAHHREPLLAHASRVMHNIFHPHHHVAAPVFLAPSATFAVCSAPELETVTVSAPAWEPPIGDDPTAPSSHGFGGGYSSAGYPTTFGGGYVSSMGGSVTHVQPVACPELSDDGAASAILFTAGMLAVIVARYRSR